MKEYKINPHQRFEKYNENECWQHYISKINLSEDINILSKYDININNYKEKISITNFIFEYIDKTNKQKCKEIKEFIEKYEWLGKLPNRPTHRFIATYHNIISGVVIMATPNTFATNLLGNEKKYKNIEKLIARGACISWSPYNLASWLLSRSMHWMVRNTDFRLFSAYSDPEAKELGTIYQALNFYYLGQNSGANILYLDPKRQDLGWHSSRNHRHKSAWYRYANEIGHKNLFKDNPNYMGKYTPIWNNIPIDIINQLKQKQIEYTKSCICRVSKPKHKYIYVLGNGKLETKKLRKLFENYNKNIINKIYPKKRGE